ncbi:MAG: hypothetical protein U9P73_01900 [Candidatus Cloacimonadota bacterium]|nr:hypothetical protein [Candidatus Cloacimonadota bacterium]
MESQNFVPEEPGFLFSANDDQGQTIFYITPESPIFMANLKSSPIQIAKNLLLNVSQGHSDLFYTKLTGNSITDYQKQSLEKQLAQIIPDSGKFFISVNDILVFITSFLAEKVKSPKLAQIE